jgi:hypothetical protein
VFILLLLPSVIDVHRFPTIRFVTINCCPRAGSFPGIVLVRHIIRFHRDIRRSRLILARSCIRPAGS